MISAFTNCLKIPELRQRIFFTLSLIFVARVGANIPLPGIDPSPIKNFFAEQAAMSGGSLIGFYNMFTGGALLNGAVFALGIMPYISAAIIMQLMGAVVPTLSRLQQEGDVGRQKISQYTRYLTIVICLVQSALLLVALDRNPGSLIGQEFNVQAYGDIILTSQWWFFFSSIIILTSGTVILMWLGEQITQRGVGNGISLIIFAGIVAELPAALASLLELGRSGSISTAFVILVLVGVVALITFIVFMERSQRRILVQYPKRQMGNKMFGGESSHLPLKLNTAGVIPPIFASSLLLMPAAVAQFSTGNANLPDWATFIVGQLAHGQAVFMTLYGAMIIFFAFFYTAIVFNPKDTADNLKKYGGFVPGIRPGQRTAEYLDYVLTRLTALGAVYLAGICLLPEFLMGRFGMTFFFLGGTSLLIVVTVTMDTVSQIQSHLLAHQYEGLIKKAKLRGARR